MFVAADRYAEARPRAPLCVAENRRRPWRRVDDGEAFWRAIDAALGPSAVGPAIARKKRALRRHLSSAAWALYLELEELEMQRSLEWVERAARWAHAAGARASRRRSRRKVPTRAE